ncbi:hypothetical protein GCM10028820_05440 [Tessaracoccus terricola]
MLSGGVDVGGPKLGRRLPRQNLTGTLTHSQRGSVEPALAVAMFETLVEAWRPMCGWLTSRDVAVAARRGGGREIPTGYRVWLRDDVASFRWLARGLTSRPFAGSVVLAAPDHWPPDRISAGLIQTCERRRRRTPALTRAASPAPRFDSRSRAAVASRHEDENRYQ